MHTVGMIHIPFFNNIYKYEYNEDCSEMYAILVLVYLFIYIYVCTAFWYCGGRRPSMTSMRNMQTYGLNKVAQ